MCCDTARCCASSLAISDSIFALPSITFSSPNANEHANDTKNLIFSDSVASNRPGDPVTDANTGEILTDISIWDLEFDKVTMYKVEFSWYGAVGALFLAYVPVSNGEARWVRVHHLRAKDVDVARGTLGPDALPRAHCVAR